MIFPTHMVGDEETILAPIDPVQVVCSLPLTGTDPRQISLTKKKELCDRYTNLLKNVGDPICVP